MSSGENICKTIAKQEAALCAVATGTSGKRCFLPLVALLVLENVQITSFWMV